MPARPSQPARLDVPHLLSGLYPRSRSRGRLEVLDAGAATGDRERVMALSQRFVWLAVFCGTGAIIAIGAFALFGSADGELVAGIASTAAAAVVGALFGTSANALAWGRFARARGLRRVQAAAVPVAVEHATRGRVDKGFALRGVVGERRVSVQLLTVEVLGSQWQGAYVAYLRLPEGTGRTLGRSSLHRRDRSSALLRGEDSASLLRLESETLAREFSLFVDGGDELAWRELFDPALVDLLAEGIDVEWRQAGDELVLLVPAPRAALAFPDARRMDTLCVAAAAIERRFALAASDGVPEPAAPAHWSDPDDPAAIAARHIARERMRDLALDPEQLFSELARFASAEEVASVRERVDRGDFPLEWLDDLVHHRRAAFWGRADVA